MAAIISAIGLIFGVASAVSQIVTAIVTFFNSPEGQAVAEAAQRIVADAEALFGHTAGITTPVAAAANVAKQHYALTTLMGDVGIGQNKALIAIAGAVEALKAISP